MESQNNRVSQHPETKGFDLSAGHTWIYPENYPVRQYQYNIVQSALYRNTMVCLPTGLGKTFIAAVIMYNFWRWYPCGKIIFLAPTKPLVAQQIDACYEVMGIPSVDMMELTGAINQKNRKIAWLKKRIIFATPQVFHNDLEKLLIPSHLIKCVVIDEAHKALGKHSYCECIKILSTQNQYYRILALSATPGNKINNVHEVIQNLHISHLELRDENSIDIMPYVNKRKVDIILVPLSNELATFKDRYITIVDRHVRLLIQYNVLRGHTANISKGRVFYLLKEFKTKTDKSGNYGQIMKTLNILLTMYHAYELMIRHGLRAFCKFYETHSDKFWMSSEAQLRDLLHDIETYLGPFPELYPNGDVSEISGNIVFGHNKFHKLKELLEHHFNNNKGDQKDTRAIVFVEYRDIVNEVYILLLQSKPIIRPQMFVGQAGQKQKQQIKALEDFRSNHVNVLISTSIGEEGLDVGEVDLIICFDVSQHSPIRLVQRMGRTGRKRDGHIIVLVTDGKEHENLKSTLSKRDSLNNKILNTSNIFSSLYDNNPRMIPNQFTPKCHKIHIVALPKTPSVKGKRKRQNANKKNEPSNMKRKENLFKNGNPGQSSITKFFTDGKCNEQNRDNTCNILTQLTTQSNNKHNTINPNNVKLLTDDNAGIDFLTLCAVKKSEEEMSSETVPEMDTTYIPAPKPIEDLFNFVVPSIEVINLDFLTEDNLTQCKDYGDNLSMQCKNEDENIYDNEDCNNVDDANFWCSIRNEGNIDNNEIKFEDILDESSGSKGSEDIFDENSNSKGFEDILDESSGSKKFEDILDESSNSNETPISYLNHRITNVEINSNETSTSTIKDSNSNETPISYLNHRITNVEINSNKASTSTIKGSNLNETPISYLNHRITNVEVNSNKASTSTIKGSNLNETPISYLNHRITNVEVNSNKASTSTIKGSNLNETPISYLNHRITNVEVNSNKASTSTIKDDDEIITDTKTKLSVNTLEDLEPSIFENILNESFSSVENDLENEDDTALRNVKSPNPSNAFTKNAGEINVTHETNVNTFYNEDNNVGANPSASMKLTKSQQIDKLENFIEELQDIDFNSDDDISEFVKCGSNKNKSMLNPNSKAEEKSSKAEESLLSITQAIGEIARANRNLQTSRKPSVSKEESIDEDSTGWISVNIKNEIKAKKNDTSLRTDNITLSNTHFNSAAKSCTAKRDLDLLDDSDEDFMIAEANAKKFDEFESCYFRNSSKDSKDDINCMPSTSKNSEIRNSYFDNTWKNLKTKDDFDNTSKSLKPCDASTPKSDRRPKLSLKRNRIQQDSAAIDLSFFKAPDKHMNNTARKSILKSSSSASKQLFPSNEKKRKLAEESERRLKRENNARNEFIDDEAEVDSDASTDEMVVTDDEDLGDFVSYTQIPQEQVDMHAHYLRTIRSPIKRPGAFHFRELQPPDPDVDIYSQYSPVIQDSYLHDSFCVEGDAEPSTLAHNDSLLDKMERELEQKKRKRLCSDMNSKLTKKKKTNILNHSMSSEDEIEQLRVQVQED